LCVDGADACLTGNVVPPRDDAEMDASPQPQPAALPDDLPAFFVERANAGDVEGLVALYEPGGVLAFEGVHAGHDEIRAAYTALLAARPRFTRGEPRPTLRSGDLALTSTRLDGGGLTVEVARHQGDGTWRWVIDDPAVVRGTGVDRASVSRWLAAYERVWRTPGTTALAEIFTDDAVYSQGPYEQPRVGLAAIAAMWEEERQGADEPFRMTAEVVAVDGDTAVARVEVGYDDPQHHEYRDLWVLRFARDGRCRSYEEWPFAPRDTA
jgi:ketosteroid isomerase-like protein